MKQINELRALLLTAFSVVSLVDVAQLAAGSSSQLAEAVVVASVRAADGGGADGVAVAVTARRTDA